MQLYTFWKYLSIGLLTLVGVISFSVLLPYYFSPIVALIAAAYLYTVLYNNKISNSGTCMIVIYAFFICLISYSFLSLIINILYIWGLIRLPAELTFFSKPYIPSLWLCPISFITMIIIYTRRRKLGICLNCRINTSGYGERGKTGNIFNYESEFQLKNLIVVFGILSVLTWGYYLLIYIDTDINGRDWYVFVGLNIITFILDELYFIFRYYNLYLDLKDNDEIITERELNEMSSRTYLRFYVICGNDIYIDSSVLAESNLSYRTVIDTPFVTKRSVTGITTSEVSSIIKKMTGQPDGELKFFFGKRNPDITKHSILRYFYFINREEEEACPEMNVNGEWMDFEKIKHIYSYKPGEMAPMFVSDLTRLATMVLTQKTFDESGFRKHKIKAYKPSFNLIEVRTGNFELQDEKWIRISMFNSDTRFYRLKRWFRGMRGGNNRRQWD